MTDISPLAPADFPDMPVIAGLSLATAATGMRYKGRDDLMLLLAEEGAVFAGCFTTSQTASAPVHLSRSGLPVARHGRLLQMPAMPMPLPVAAEKRRYMPIAPCLPMRWILHRRAC